MARQNQTESIEEGIALINDTIIDKLNYQKLA